MRLTKWNYIALISERGDNYGGRGGIYDLLNWCKKTNTNDVTEDEARRYYEDPAAPYELTLAAD